MADNRPDYYEQVHVTTQRARDFLEKMKESARGSISQAAYTGTPFIPGGGVMQPGGPPTYGQRILAMGQQAAQGLYLGEGVFKIANELFSLQLDTPPLYRVAD